MTTIRTTCPRCGEVDMGPEAILLSVRHPAGDGSYRFACPACGGTVEKHADRKIIALLLSAGVELADGRETVPQGKGRQGQKMRTGVGGEPSLGIEAEDVGIPAPPLTVDDLIDFHLLLQDDERFYDALPKG